MSLFPLDRSIFHFLNSFSSPSSKSSTSLRCPIFIQSSSLSKRGRKSTSSSRRGALSNQLFWEYKARPAHSPQLDLSGDVVPLQPLDVVAELPDCPLPLELFCTMARMMKVLVL